MRSTLTCNILFFTGIVSIIWPLRARMSGDIVQTCCALDAPPLDICDITVFERTCFVGLTRKSFQIWSLTTFVDGVEVISVLNEPVHSLVRRVRAPDGVAFETCCSSGGLAQKLITSCSDGNILVWDPIAACVISSFITSTTPAEFSQVLAQQKFVRFCHAEGLVLHNDSCSSMKVFDVNSSKCVTKTISVSSDVITCASIDDSFRPVVVSANPAGDIYVGKGKGLELLTPGKPNTPRVSAIEVIVLSDSPEFIVVVTGNANGSLDTIVYSLVYLTQSDSIGYPTVRLLLSDAFNVQPYKKETKVNLVQSLGENMLLTGCEDGSPILWIVTLKGLSKIGFLQASSTLTCAVIHREDNIIVCGYADGSIIVYDSSTYVVVASIPTAHAEGVLQVGIVYDSDRCRTYISSVDKFSLTVRLWKYLFRSVKLDRDVSLPEGCRKVQLWTGGPCNLAFVENKDGTVFSVDLLRIRDGPVAYYLDTTFRFWMVSGRSGPVMLSSGALDMNVISVWNNGAHSQHFLDTRISDAFVTNCLSKPDSVSTQLQTLLRSHPHYPNFLLSSHSLSSDMQTLFAKAILYNFPAFVTTFLPEAPLAVTIPSCIRGESMSLLSLAIVQGDMSSIDCILSTWSKLMSTSSSSLEENVWHCSELFHDIKFLSRRMPSKCSSFIAGLHIPPSHAICIKGCLSRPVSKDEFWMRGTALRVVPDLWANISDSGPAYSEMESRIYDDGQSSTRNFESPHTSMQTKFSSEVDGKGMQYHPSVLLENLATERMQMNESQNWDAMAHDDISDIPNPIKMFQMSVVVQAHCHPIPHAAGSDFLKLCLRCCCATGSNALLCSPSVTTVLDYKWNTYVYSQQINRTIHFVSLLAVFTMLNVYFDTLVQQPTETGLEILVWLLSIILIVNYGVLMFQEVLVICINGISFVYYHSMIYSILAYGTAFCGLVLQVTPQDNHGWLQINTSFNSRCILAAASIMLYLKLFFMFM